jgi:glycosyltransferase involved in cell wall biosynthesis
MTECSSISVIVPCHNARGTIFRALRSVAEQTVVPAEVVVADDASTDGTSLFLEQCQAERWPFILNVVRLGSRSGPGVARNAAWRAASPPSRYVAFLDADDIWLPHKVETQLCWMENNPAYGWSAHACGIFDASARARHEATRPDSLPRFTPLSRRRMLIRNPVATPSVMARCPAPSRFRSDWDRCEDLMLWIDWLDAGYAGAILDQPLALLGRPPKAAGGLTGDLRRMFASELRIFDTLVSEHRMSACIAGLWKLYASGRFQLRTLRA